MYVYNIVYEMGEKCRTNKVNEGASHMKWESGGGGGGTGIVIAERLVYGVYLSAMKESGAGGVTGRERTWCMLLGLRLPHHS
jgi:hypothetical protein